MILLAVLDVFLRSPLLSEIDSDKKYKGEKKRIDLREQWTSKKNIQDCQQNHLDIRPITYY